MDVDVQTTKYVARYGNTDYWFCTAGCKAIFQSDPTSYTL
jgi:YHS domain-containing protein